MNTVWSSSASLLLAVVFIITTERRAAALNIPLEIEQLPTITDQSPTSVIGFPFEESIAMKCEARGNPEPEYRWTKDGLDFDPNQDPRLLTEEDSGSFLIPNTGNLTEYQGVYRCYASNKLGTALSDEIEFIVPHVPKFPKEKIDPIEVEEGQPFVLECNPPKGIPPLQIYWMTLGLQHIEQDERVSMGLDGNLYFSNALEKDSRRDYCCFAAFPLIRTIVQKTAMSVIVRSTKSVSDSESESRANALLQRKPSLLTPPGGETEVRLVKGEDLELECISEGFPTPRIEWTKTGQGLPDRASVENHGKLLTISHVQEEDNGKYMCKARNSHGEITHYFHVRVEEPPKWTLTPESQIVPIDSDVLIKCAATGLPQPKITWRVNGLPFSEVLATNRKFLDDTIIVHKAKPSDSAVYQCEASNRHGTLLANANIMVMNLPPMILTQDRQEYAAVAGSSVLMHCRVFSSPPSTISWTNDDTAESVEGSRFFVHENGSLEIHSVEKEDMGQYTCVTTNKEGKSAITATLDIKDPTHIVEPPQDLRVVRGAAAQLTCQAQYDQSLRGGSMMVWEKDGVEIAANASENDRYFVDEGILQITNVSHRDQGIYTCTAQTSLDQDAASAHLIVLDVPDAPTDLLLFEHKDRSVKLQWLPGDEHNSSTTEFVIDYEESQWEPGRWKEQLRVQGNHVSALLKLHGHVDYRFRVSAVNAVGRGQASEATGRYRTPPAAPDRNPEDIRIEGHLPHEMDIIWEPLLPIEHNGPGLEYKVSYRRQGEDYEWQEQVVKRHSFVVKNTPTFVPYEIKIQARNHQGWGPEAQVVTGYSGEDFPAAAPEDVTVEVMNGSLIKVSWVHVPKDKLQGHLGGYRVTWWRLRGLMELKKSHGEKHSLTFPGERSHVLVPGLAPFSEYSLSVVVFNGRGNGPSSHPVTFKTPEGVPERISILRATNAQRTSLTLVWAPPVESNGVLTGYLLQYQLINDTEDVGTLLSLNINSSDTNKWVLEDLEPLSRYKFYVCACSRVGCGPPLSEEGSTVLHTRLVSINGGISSQSWFIGLMCAVALLTLVALVACFINRNKGGKYSVKEKEDLHPDVESQGMNDDTFCEYSDNDEKPLQGSLPSLVVQLKADSGDSLVDYGVEDVQFNEDGSFIGEYAGRKQRNSSEVKGSGPASA